MKSPVLFLIFNRPVETAQVFDAIRQASPTRLYVAADGPRPDRLDELDTCRATREIISRVDWPCEVHTLYRERNLGCRRAVSEAISWFFGHESEGIILEDDCLPHESFFPYCDELLERYRATPRVMAICGSNYGMFDGSDGGRSYTFARTFDPWGWATWRRAWLQYDRDLEQLSSPISRRRLRDSGPRILGPEFYWLPILHATRNGILNTWDYQWMFTIFLKMGLVAHPSINLISNIGYGDAATHTTENESSLSMNPTSPLEFPLKHPPSVYPDRSYEMSFYRRRLDYGISAHLTRRYDEYRARVSRSTPRPIKQFAKWLAGKWRFAS